MLILTYTYYFRFKTFSRYENMIDHCSYEYNLLQQLWKNSGLYSNPLPLRFQYGAQDVMGSNPVHAFLQAF